jgi:hypothetical protein
MAESMVRPRDFVNLMINPGLDTIAGKVQLNQYMSGNKYNGGNDSTRSLFKNLRWYHDGPGKGGPRLNDLLGTTAIDLALKGQGTPASFVGIWNFMIRNRDKMKYLDMKVYHRRQRHDPDTKLEKQAGNVYDLYFKGRSDRDAIQKMVADRIFGIDCIGFVGNFLIWSGEWSKYHSVGIDQYASKSCKIEVSETAEIKVLDFLIWNGHIALIDYVRYLESNKVMYVDICQSSSGGPQRNEWVRLERLSSKGPGGRRQFKIGGGGIPVDGIVYIQRREGWFY